MSADSATEHRWKCSHDIKTRLPSLVAYYSRRLRHREIDFEAAHIWAGLEQEHPQQGDSATKNNNGNNNETNHDDDDDDDEKNSLSADSAPSSPVLAASSSPSARITEEQIKKLSLALTKKAFETPPSFLIPDDDPEPFPAHCFKFDILSAPSLKSAISSVSAASAHSSSTQEQQDAVTQLEQMLQKGTSDFHTVIFAFTDHTSVVSGDVGDDRDTIVQCFNKLSSLSIGDFAMKWSNRVRDVCDMVERGQSNFAKQGQTTLFDCLPIANSTLLDRCVAWLFLTIPALNAEALQRVCRLLSFADADQLAKMIGRISPESMSMIVESLQSSFTIALVQAENRLSGGHNHLNLLGSVLSLFHKANTAVVSRGLVKYSAFYNAEAISFDDDEIVHDFRRWMKVQEESSSNLFSFSKYPCLVDTRFKSKLLQFEGVIAIHQAQREGMMAMLFGQRRQDVENEMYCILKVKRDNLLETTVREMNRNSSRLKKPLKVVFTGTETGREDGIDAGGLTKEFFQLLFRQLLNPGFGMFEQKESNRVLWLMPDVSTEYLRQELFLVGQLLGLAAYNNVIIDVSFPKVLYRKILGATPDLEDLRELDPGMANGLDKLLEWDEDQNGVTVQDAFCRTFTYEHDVFGSTVEVELCPGGKNRELTLENRKEYVRLLVNYLLVDGVKKSFEQLKSGFLSIVSSRELISTMHPEELEMLLCGQRNFDFNELKESCSYEGYEEDGSDDVIKWFWNVLQNSLTPEQQKKFLHFSTGSDRIPVGGLKELHFKIGKNGDKDEQLPTAHTCFNHLLLPQYSSEEVLKTKLLLAIENCEGFGLQ